MDTTPPRVPNRAWKALASYQREEGYYTLATEDTRGVPVRLFLTPALLEAAEEDLYPQIVNATRFPGVQLVVITPDVHQGYGVPVGCVILTSGTIALGPVGYDIGCGMISLRSEVPAERATPGARMAFSRAVMSTVAMGVGSVNKELGTLEPRVFEALVRGGAREYVRRYGSRLDPERTEGGDFAVADSWQMPKGRADRGRAQLGTLGGGNHFIELQRCEETQSLFVQIHTGSRGFGHGLAQHYFERARAENPAIRQLDMGYFAPDSPTRADYLSAVAAGRNFATINRLIIAEQVIAAFEDTFGGKLELIAEISHNLVQRETHPEFGRVWVHRKGATRAFPAGHPDLAGTQWADTGYPILVPGSNRDYSYVLDARPNASRSAYSVNHGAGRRMARKQALRTLSQRDVNQRYRHAGVLVNAGADVPLDESDAVYKPAGEVLEAILAADLAAVRYTLWPLASLKGAD
ncbi:MAG: RtcB family protein [Chloroflexi bacterium]|nr:RtcB family protein [Chloroflexota bacterium]